MLNSNTKEMQSKATVGNITVWSILLVSLAATLAYWYVLAGLETASGLSSMWHTLLWVSVAVGLVAEIIKKVTLSTFRNKRIWLAATLVSILTVLGTYSILNQTRQNDLVKQSDSYQDSRANKKAADFLASQYAYAAGYDLPALEAELDQVIVDRDNRKIKYNTYLSRKKALEEKIAAKRNYDSAASTSNIATANMSSSGSVSSSSNPLLASISGVFNLSESFLTMAFYLFVTILLEVAAFWIGGEVEKIRKHMKLTEAELLDMKNQELFGFSVRDVQRDLFERVKRSQQDAIQAESEVQQIRKTRKDDDSEKPLPAGEVAASVQQKRTKADDSQVQAKSHSPTPAPHPAPVGFRLPNVVASSAEKNRLNATLSRRDTVAQTTVSEPYCKVSVTPDTVSRITVSEQPDTVAKTTVSEQPDTVSKTTVSEPYRKVSLQPDTVAKSTVSNPLEAETNARKNTLNDEVYQSIKKAVKNGQCRCSIRGMVSWLKTQGVGGTNNPTRQATAENAMNRLYDEKIVTLNPKWIGKSSGVNKYLLKNEAEKSA